MLQTFTILSGKFKEWFLTPFDRQCWLEELMHFACNSLCVGDCSCLGVLESSKTRENAEVQHEISGSKKNEREKIGVIINE